MKTKTLASFKFILVVTLLSAMILAGCSGSAATNGTTIGSGKVINETREATGFTSVEYSTSGYLTIVQGDTEGITIQAEDNIVPLITSDVVDGVLVIGIKDNQAVQINNLIQITLNVKDLSAVENLSSGYVSIPSYTGTDFSYKSSGSGNLKISAFDAKTLTVDLTGSGYADIRGVADTLTANMTGSGNLEAAQLAVVSADVTSTGSANAVVNASDALTVTLSGSGNVTYVGTPEVTQNITGTGTVSAQ